MNGNYRSDAGRHDGTLEPMEGYGSGHSIFQLAGALFGILLIVIGLIIVLYLFFRVLGYFDEPERFGGLLDKWELVIRGEADASDTVEIKMKEGAQANGQELPIEGISLPFNIPRYFAAFVMVLVLGMLIRLGFGVIKAGGHLVALANPYKEMFMKLNEQFAKVRGSTSSSNRSSD